MKIVEQDIIFEEEINGEAIIRKIENAARTCYKAEHAVGGYDRAKQFVGSLIRRGHESTIEHVSISARVITNRGVSHEWVRHRVGCSYSQESTRYCNYSAEKFGNEISVIVPWYLGNFTMDDLVLASTGTEFQEDHERAVKRNIWFRAMEFAEASYLNLLNAGCKPEEARGVLPNDLKTEFVTTMTLRAWRHFFKLRATPAAHPQIRALAFKAFDILSSKIPVVFDDILAHKVVAK